MTGFAASEQRKYRTLIVGLGVPMDGFFLLICPSSSLCALRFFPDMIHLLSMAESLCGAH